MREMKQYPNWVCHRNKIPIDPKTGATAKSNDPSTWGTYEQAQECIKKDPSLSGLGFMFSHSPYVGIDIDHCIQGGVYSKLALDILHLVQSYAEISPSGTGLHIICKGQLNSPGRKNTQLGLEIYDSGRYFTVTENTLEPYPQVLESQSQIDNLLEEYFNTKTVQKSIENTQKQHEIYSIDDEKVLEIAKKSKNGAKFADLYAGNWQNYYKSQSEADIALCNALAFYTNRDDSQMDRLFRGSGLMRDKWDIVHGIHTYGENTITKAIDSCEKVYEPAVTRDFQSVVVDIQPIENQTERKQPKKQPQSAILAAPLTDNTIQTGALDRFHKFNAKGQIIGVFDNRIKDYILETEHIISVGGMVYVYRDGVYQMDIQGAYIKSIIQNLIYEEFRNVFNINKIYNYILVQHSIYKSYSEVNQYPDTWINFKNGMLDLKSLELLPHDPKYYAMNQIPHEWKGSEYKYKHEYYDYFIKTSLHNDDVQTLLEYMGYCMTRSTRYQIFLLLKGEGDNGKSIVIDLFNAAIGEQNISSIGMDKLTERFYSAQLLFKLCNTCADISKVTIEDDSELKKIIAGDMIQAEFKGQNSFNFRPYAKLFFSANRFPYVDDRSEGFKRRLRVITMDKKPPQKDKDLMKKLIEEIDYLIFSAVVFFANALNGDDEIKESETAREAKEELHKESDSVYAFIKDCLIEVEGHDIKRAEMYKEYDKYCKFYERIGLTKKAFFLEMQAKGFAVKRDNTGNRIYKNYGITKWEEENKDLDPFS